MKLFFSLTALALSLSSVSGCTTSCTEVGCDSGVNVTINQLAAAASFPITIEVCPGTTECSTFTVTSATDCTGSGEFARDCGVSADGTVELTASFPTAPEGGSLDVHVTVKDSAAATLIDAHQTVTITEFAPNGESCGPVCAQGGLTLTP